MNWLPGNIQVAGLDLSWSHVIIEKRVAQVGPTEGTIYDVWGYFKGGGEKKNALK